MNEQEYDEQFRFIRVDDSMERARERRRKRYSMLPILVYAWMAPDGTVDYVGRGTMDRAKSWRSQGSWWTPQHTLLTMSCDSEWQAMEYEGIWGARYRPQHNIDGYRR